MSYPSTFDPFVKYEGCHLYDQCELLLNNITVLTDILLMDRIDTPYKTWNPYAKLNSKFVEAYKTRTQKELTYDQIMDWSLDDEHGFVHSFFVAFWSTYLLNKREKRIIHTLFSTEDNDFIELFYASLVHDMYRIFQDDDHDKNLEKIYPNCIKETYTHTNPEDESRILIIADRIELMRYGFDEIDFTVFDGYLEENELEVIEFFYKNYREKFQKAWECRNDPLITHYVENWDNWDFKAENYPSTIHQDMPKNKCSVFVRQGMYHLQDINDRFFMFGVIPVKDIQSSPVEFINEHPCLEHDRMNKKEDWIFLYTIPNHFQRECIKHELYPIRHDLMTSFLHLSDQLFCNLILNSFRN